MKTPAFTLGHRSGLDTIIMILVGTITSGALVVAGTMELKWTVFITCAVICVSAVFIIPEREKFFLYFFFFALAIGLDFYPIHVPRLIYRPLSGLIIHFYDIPLFFLFISWMLRLIMDPSEKIRFFPKISLPFLCIFILTIIGLRQSVAPSIVKISSIWVVFKCFLIFLYLANNLKKRIDINIIIIVIFSTMVFQALVGFAQQATGGHLGIGIVGESRESFREMRAGSGKISRVGGFIGSPNKLAGYLGRILTINLALFFAKIDTRLKLVFLLPVFLIGCLLDLMTFSRGGWLGLGIGGGFTIYWCLVKLTRRKVVSFILLASFLLTSIVLTVALVEPVRRRLFAEDYGAAYTRVPMTIVALNIIKHNPFLGIGLGNYTMAALSHDTTREAISYTFPWPVHNEFLLFAAELGLPAFCLFLFILGVVTVQLRRIGSSKADPVIPYLAIGLFGGLLAWSVHNQFEFDYVILNAAMWSNIGLIQAMHEIIQTSEKKERLRQQTGERV